MRYSASTARNWRKIVTNKLQRIAAVSGMKFLRLGLWLPLGMLAACAEKLPEQVALSERPEEKAIPIQFEAETSQLGVRLRVSYDDLVSVIETAVPASQTDAGQDKVCKKILGMKACSTVRWNYTLNRTGGVSIMPDALATERVRIAFPFEFEGTAGLSGDLAKVLGLSKLEFDGALDLATSSRFDMSEDWCPQIDAEVDYRWTRAPRVEFGGGLDFNIRKLVDSQLKKELRKVDEHLASAIDCEKIRTDLAANWRAHSMPLDISPESLIVAGDEGVAAEDAALASSGGTTGTEVAGVPAISPMYFNVLPVAASFSGVKTEADTVGLTLQLDAKLSIDAQPLVGSEAAGNEGVTLLPPLQTIPYAVGDTIFTPLIRAPYETLRAFSLAAVQGETYRSDSKAGEISVEVTDIDIFPSGSRLGIGINFKADLPASKPVQGQVYMTALPNIDATGSELAFTDFEFTKVLDNAIWNSLATLFEGRIVRELEENARLDLREKLLELEVELLAELADTGKTRGAVVRADDLTIRLGRLLPEQDALALVLVASTRLDVELPFEVFNRELAKP